MVKYFSTLLILILIWSCSGSVETSKDFISSSYYEYEEIEHPYFEIPNELKNRNNYTRAITIYSEYLNGAIIFLDPGHGGMDRKNRSRNNKVVEADVNLKVALYLKEYLQDSGAEVIMSRDKDTTISLEERSIMVNESGADLFISIHHNATGDSLNFWTNYTSTFYHANEDDYEYEPFERNMARYVQRDLAYAMRNSGGTGTFDGAYSDYVIYPQKGFAVLRETRIPAILVECSFFTNRMEEARLSVDAFNKVEAWGIFKGLAKFYKDGIPQFEFDKSSSSFENGKLNLVFKIDKGRLNPSSVTVFVDSLVSKYELVGIDKIKISIEENDSVERTIKIISTDEKGFYTFPFERKIVIK